MDELEIDAIRHKVSKQLRSSNHELDKLLDTIPKPTEADWGPLADLHDYVESLHTLSSFASSYIGLDHNYDPTRTNCAGCVQLALDEEEGE